MDQQADAMHRALSRIDAAITRIEAAASKSAPGDGDLAARHDRLRSAVTQTLRDIDQLIAGQPR